MTPGVGRLLVATAGLAGLLAGCGPSRPAVATYQASVTNVSATQAEDDRHRIAQVFADLAGQRGLIREARFPASEGAVYFPGPTGLNLSLSVLKLDERALAISVIPVAQGRQDHAACRAVIAAVDQALQKTFSSRLVKSP